MLRKQISLLKNSFFILPGAICTAMALVLDLNVGEAPESGITNPLYKIIYKVLEILQQDLEGKGFMITVFTIFFFYAYHRVWVIRQSRPVGFSRLLSMIFSIGYTAGIGFAYANTLSVLFDSDIRLLKSIIIFVGMYILYLTAINVLYDFFRQGKDISLKRGKWRVLYEKYPWRFCWGMIMGIWLVHILIRYPGTMSYDNWNQLSFFFGYQAYSDWQPIFHTWVFGAVIQIGLWLGSANLGLFLFILLQSLIMSAILAWSLVLMKRWNAPQWLSVLTLGIYCVAPYFAGYASFPIKDYLYTAFFLLMLLLIMEWLREGDTFWGRKGSRIAWITSATLMILFRNNGKYIYVPLIILMAIMELHGLKRKKQQVKEWGTKAIYYAAPLVLVMGVTWLITVCYDVQHNSPKEMLSLPFQQTARYVRDYGDEVTEEERVAIDGVLRYELLAEEYYELTADPVKSTYHAEGTGELIAYFKVWLQQFFKHPLCYVEATWNQNYYLLAPNIDNIVHNKDCNVGEEIMVEYGILDVINFEVPDWMHGLCTIMVSYYSLLYRLPIIGLLNNVAFYVMLMLVMASFMIQDKRKKELLVFFPLFLSLLIVILAPQIQNQPRYAFPIIYTMPAVVAFYIQGIRSKRKKST